jgi:NAD(P)H-dependent flavin oxidoreductase YrpB (nitropropane dioxygenase family)
MNLDTPLTRQAGIDIPLIGGAMYPCSNPELVAAISDAGAIGTVQPVSLTYVHGHDFREGLRFIRRLTPRPIGMNALIEASSKTYHERMVRWVEIALEEGVRFFVTSLGKPRWVVDRVAAVGGVVYHDVTERKWALKGRDDGVHGLIAVNRRAGGHAGSRTPAALLEEVGDLDLPVVAAGGIGDAAEFVEVLRLGYAGAQLGTRFIATTECTASAAYKRAIVDAGEADIVHTERMSGVPLAVIRTPYVEKVGTTIGPLARWLFKGRRTKKWIRAFYALRTVRQLKRTSITGGASADDPGTAVWQAGKSVATIHAVEPVATIVTRFARAAREA